MKKIFIGLLFSLFCAISFGQTITVPYDSLFRVTHDTIQVSTKDSTYKISKDSTYKISKDSAYKVKVDSSFTVKSDSVYKVKYDSIYTIKVDSTYKIFRDSSYKINKDSSFSVKHDSGYILFKKYTVPTTHDTTYPSKTLTVKVPVIIKRKTWPNRTKTTYKDSVIFIPSYTEPTTHDTTISSISNLNPVTHDTTVSVKKDTTSKFYKDTSVLVNRIFSKIAYKDTTVTVLNKKTVQTTKDTVVKVDIIVNTTVYKDTTIKIFITNTSQITHDTTAVRFKESVILNPVDEKTFGLWGNGTVDQKSISALMPNIRGWNIRISWSDIQTGPNTWNWAYLDNMIKICQLNKIKAFFMVYVGDNSPNFIYSSPYNVPKVITTGANAAQASSFPYYYDSNYQKLTYVLWDSISKHISNYSPELKSTLIAWMSAEGSTGDTGPYKGTPDTKYKITASSWIDYRHSVWNYINDANKKYKNSFLHLLINPGNDGRDWDWALLNLPEVWLKSGNSGHQYIFDDEMTQIKRNLTLTSNDYSHRIRTEFEGVDKGDPSFNEACVTHMVFYALTSNVDFFCVAASKNIYMNGLRYYSVYGGLRDPNKTTLSYSYSSGAIEEAGLTTTTVNSLIASGASNKVGLYLNDFATNALTGNYERFLHMYGESEIMYRVSTGTFGRYARRYTNATFVMDDRLLQPSVVTITYFDTLDSMNVIIDGVTYVIRGTGTNTVSYKSFSIKSRSFSIQGKMPVFLLETK